MTTPDPATQSLRELAQAAGLDVSGDFGAHLDWLDSKAAK